MYDGHIRLLGTLPEFANFKTFSIAIDNPPYPDPFRVAILDFIVPGRHPNITVVSNDMVQPLAHQASAGISHRLSDGLLCMSTPFTTIRRATTRHSI